MTVVVVTVVVLVRDLLEDFAIACFVVAWAKAGPLPGHKQALGYLHEWKHKQEGWMGPPPAYAHTQMIWRRHCLIIPELSLGI